MSRRGPELLGHLPAASAAAEGEKLKQDLHWWSSTGQGWGYFGAVTSLSTFGELSDR